MKKIEARANTLLYPVPALNMYEEMIHMELKAIDHNLSVCKVSEIADIDMSANFFFVAKTDGQTIRYSRRTSDWDFCSIHFQYRLHSGEGRKLRAYS